MYYYGSTVKAVDMTTYKRQHIFESFKNRQLPFFSMTCQVDISSFISEIKGLSFFSCMCYAISKVVNKIPEFRQRIIGETLVEFDKVHPGFIKIDSNNVITFGNSEHKPLFWDFYPTIKREMYSDQPEKILDKNSLFFVTSNQWTSFTSFTHPYDPVGGSIPIVTIGKYYKDGNKTKVPIALQVHHGVMDGFHAGQFYSMLEDELDNFFHKQFN
jgi:chloramphenicol O-acetyltransferase type A